MIIMPNKTYKLYSDGVVLNFIFQDKSFTIKAPTGAKIIATYMVGDAVKSLYGKLKSITLNEIAEGNDKLIFTINNTSVIFSSIVSLDIVEEPKSSDGTTIDISNPSEPQILLSDLLLQDLDNLYSSLNAEDAFKEIALKIKDINTTAGVSIDDVNTSSTTTTLSASKIIDTIIQNITSLVDGSTENLNTFKEFATAINNDPTFATNIINELGNKVDKIAGKGLSTNDFDATYKAKVDKISTIGDGTKFLSDNGTYVVPPDSGVSIDDASPASIDTTYSAAKIEQVTGNKVDKIAGKGLSTNDFDATYKAKVDKILDTGTGGKVLSDNGTYIDLPSGSTGVSIDDAAPTSTSTTYSAAKIEELAGSKVEKVEGKGLSTNDYNAIDKAKVDKIITIGDGTKFLSDNGTYGIPEGNGVSIDDAAPTSTSTTYSAAKIEQVTGNKVDKIEGKGLSTNDYSTDDKGKVDKLITIGDGSKVLSDNGTYITPPAGTGTIDHYTDQEMIDLVNTVWGV